MSMRMRSKLLALALAGAALPAASRALDASPGGIVPVAIPFGEFASKDNPTGLKMTYYVPDGATAPMPIVVALHGCEGHPADMLKWLKAQADANHFMLLMPDVNRYNSRAPTDAKINGCWDVGSDAALHAPYSSDQVGVVALVKYAQTSLMCPKSSGSSEKVACGDPARVFATGQSSGAMMTNLLLAEYPDVFSAGAVFMGVPFGCWALPGTAAPSPGGTDKLGSPAGWSGACAGGTVTKSPEEWAALIPPTGQLPRVLLWHGETDTLISYKNFGEEVEQSTLVRGVAGVTPVTEYPLASASGATWNAIWTRARYGEGPLAPVEAIHVSGTGHNVVNPEFAAAEAVRFFGLGDAAAPTAPANLAASKVKAGGVTLAWDAATDAVGVTHYVVLGNDGTTTTAVAWPKASPFDVVGLKPSTSYTVTVFAADQAGNLSAASNAVTVDTPEDTTPPAAPGGLSAASVADTSASLKWTAATDDVGVTGYVVSRKDATGSTQVGAPTTTSFDLTDLAAGTAYTFEVVAKDAAGHASPVATVTFTTTKPSSGGGGGGCGQGVPSGAALMLAAAALLLVRRRQARA